MTPPCAMDAQAPMTPMTTAIPISSLARLILTPPIIAAHKGPADQSWHSVYSGCPPRFPPEWLWGPTYMVRGKQELVRGIAK